ncbi:MAG: glutamate ligase domain-containing protein [Thermoplasmata archaeon]
MGYEDTVGYLYGLQRFGIKLGLDNIRDLLSRLGDPHRGFRSIHVAGSNGKGSVCAFLDSILRRAGYRVGLYTSPHLVRFNERIKVNGIDVSDEDVVRLTEEIRPHAEAMTALAKASQPTFFEFTTAMAFQYFREQDVDAALVEVGMGGRLDATNVVRPEVAAITRIGMEHTEYLGMTLERIAREKAGIIKEGIPVWTVDQPAVDVIEERCRALGAPLRVVGRDLHVARTAKGLEGQKVLFSDDGTWEYDVALLGSYQAENAALAFGVIQELRERGWRISETAVRRGYSEARWPARLQVVNRYPTIVLDSTHTTEGAQELRKSLEELFPGRRLILVIGILRDKDLKGMVAQLMPLCQSVIATEADTERAFRAEQVAEAFRGAGSVKVVRRVAEAVDTALSMAGSNDIVLITGSLYTAGEASIFLEEWKRKRAEEVVLRLKQRYLPGDFASAHLETALGKITRETGDPFVVLISTVLSQRTADPTTEKVSANLFSRYRTPSELGAASLEDLEEVIRPANFYKTKAKAIKDISQRIAGEYGGVVPREMQELRKLPLVGQKTANCVLVYGYGVPAIPVDVHCHRIPNRLGLLQTKDEADTEVQLRRLLPESLWLEVNELFVRHGQTTCTSTRPDCPSCNLADLCAYNLSRQQGASQDMPSSGVTNR